MLMSGLQIHRRPLCNERADIHAIAPAAGRQTGLSSLVRQRAPKDNQQITMFRTTAELTQLPDPDGGLVATSYATDRFEPVDGNPIHQLTVMA